MKFLYSFLAVLLVTTGLYAQSPEKMSYQAVIRDANNNLVAEQVVGVQISILQGSATGTAVYVETHVDTTNINGLISLEIGAGSVVSGDLGMINWGAGPYFIQSETDPTGGSNYTISGTSELTSVPYAFHAISADKATNAITAETADTATVAVKSITADSAAIAAQAHELVNPKKRAYVITPGMINDFNNGAAYAIKSTERPVIIFPDNGSNFVDFNVSLALPVDYDQGAIRLRVYYSGDVAGGNFRAVVGGRGVPVGGDLTQYVIGNIMTIPGPTSANTLMEFGDSLTTPSDSRFYQLTVRRVSGDASDTNTGEMHVMAVVIEFD